MEEEGDWKRMKDGGRGELEEDEEWNSEEIRQGPFDKIFVDHEVHDLNSGTQQPVWQKHRRCVGGWGGKVGVWEEGE